MSNEESLIPKVNDYITPAMAIQVPLHIQNIWISAMKQYAKDAVNKALEEAAKEEFDCPCDGWESCQNSASLSNQILELKNSDRLKIS